MKSLNPKYVRLHQGIRMYNLDVPVVGLTGGISTGKSSVAKLMEAYGLPVINADLLVKEVYRKQNTKDFIADRYPDCMKNNEIDFSILRSRFFRDTNTKSIIEKFIYKGLPEAFMNAFEKLGPVEMLVYDIPLLFEKRMETTVDLSVVVYAPPKVQRSRLMIRDGHMENQAQNIMDQQIPIDQKRGRADFVVDNSGTLEELATGVNKLLQQIIV